MGRFLNPFTDIGFKKIFGQEIHKDLLIDFLNQLLRGERTIVDLEYMDKEVVPEYEGDRSSIFDIYCRTDAGEYIIVEMQNQMQDFFSSRAVYYMARSIARQGERGSNWRFRLDAVYGIFFMNFSHESVMPRKFRTDVILADKADFRLFSDKLRMIFLQLPEFRFDETECNTDFERWIYILKHMETLNRMPFTRNAVFKKLESIMDIASLSKEEREKYDATIDAYRDHLAVLAFAEKEGLQKGMQQGIQKGMQKGLREGEAKKQLEIARNLRQMGLSDNQIATATGLTLEQVKELV